MKNNIRALFALLMIIVLGACSARKESCGAYNRGGGAHGQNTLTQHHH